MNKLPSFSSMRRMNSDVLVYVLTVALLVNNVIPVRLKAFTAHLGYSRLIIHSNIQEGVHSNILEYISRVHF